MSNKQLYREDLTKAEISSIFNYLKLRLRTSQYFNSEFGYWYEPQQSNYSKHFVLMSEKKYADIIHNGPKEFKDNYFDLLKFFELNPLHDDFSTDFVFTLKDNIDLTCLYGLARIAVE